MTLMIDDTTNCLGTSRHYFCVALKDVTWKRSSMDLKLTYSEIILLVQIHCDVSSLDGLVALNDPGLTSS